MSPVVASAAPSIVCAAAFCGATRAACCAVSTSTRVLPLIVVEHGLPEQRLGAVGLQGERAREGVLGLAVAQHARVGVAEADERLGRRRAGAGARR